MTPFSLSWAAKQVGGVVTGSPEARVQGICTDTRANPANSLFFALRGERSDGHAFVRQALSGGAVAAVVAKEGTLSDLSIDGALVVVDDPLIALGDLAAAYRSQFHLPLIGITGSVGKTSTKEMLAAILRAQYVTLASSGNFNNEIGLPLTMFQLNDEHRAAVIEMAMRGSGQIARLAEIARPTVGLITNIGYSHVELLGSQVNIAQAKAELLAGLSPGGIAVIPTEPAGVYLGPEASTFANDSKWEVLGAANVSKLSGLNRRLYAILSSAAPPGCRIVTYGSGGDISLVRSDESDRTSISRADDGSIRVGIRLRVDGDHHYRNAEAALAAAWSIGVPLEAATAALCAWSGTEGRLTVRYLEERDITIIDDCYNAAPESMAAAIDHLAESPPGHRVAVLGDMRELGDYAHAAHRIVGARAADAGLRVLVTVGDLARGIARELVSASDRLLTSKPLMYEFADTLQASREIRSIVQPGDSVLVKGSRALQMEQIVEELSGQAANNRHG